MSKMPTVAENAFIAETAVIIGDVVIEPEASVWFNATIRADRGSVRIRRGANIQDNVVVHMDDGMLVDIGERVSVGHGAIVHGAVIGENSLVGMGAILMNGCRVGKNCVIGAGALVTQGTEIPDNSLVFGSPAKVVREVTDEEREKFAANSAEYIKEAALYREGGYNIYRCRGEVR